MNMLKIGDGFGVCGGEEEVEEGKWQEDEMVKNCFLLDIGRG